VTLAAASQIGTISSRSAPDEGDAVFGSEHK
jgi:hypothetical protein